MVRCGNFLFAADVILVSKRALARGKVASASRFAMRARAMRSATQLVELIACDLVNSAVGTVRGTPAKCKSSIENLLLLDL